MLDWYWQHWWQKYEKFTFINVMHIYFWTLLCTVSKMCSCIIILEDITFKLYLMNPKFPIKVVFWTYFNQNSIFPILLYRKQNFLIFVRAHVILTSHINTGNVGIFFRGTKINITHWFILAMTFVSFSYSVIRLGLIKQVKFKICRPCFRPIQLGFYAPSIFFLFFGIYVKCLDRPEVSFFQNHGSKIHV